jgi:hypothetical protein
MNRRALGVRPSWAVRLGPWVLAVFLVGPVGCTGPLTLTRPQVAEETERERYELQTLGDITDVGNVEPVPLGGIALVAGLDGTGGEAAPEDRSRLEDELRHLGVKDIKKWVNSPDTAVVYVSGVLPTGARKGDRVDIDVALTPRSRATSLRGGYLMECVLYNYDFTRNLTSNPDAPQVALRGHPVAKAEGPVLVGLGEGDEGQRVKRGRVWNGARLTIDWPLTLVLKADHQSATWAATVAERINDVFDGGLRAGGTAVAKARDPMNIPVRVPVQYRLNQPHYLRVVRAITLYECADLPDDRPDNRSYRTRLTADLLDPAHTVSAALRLEALGSSGVPSLLPGLKSPHLLVRFSAAQALAYLNSPSCADELARIVRYEPLLRAYALTALASLEESVAETRLAELLTSGGDDETRYGAFRALRARNERNPLVRGELLNNSFWLHRVPGRTEPLVHVCSNHRAEIIVFGAEPALQPPFAFSVADFTVKAEEGDAGCTVSRYPAHGVPGKRQCRTMQVEEVLRAMADLGGTYPEAVELLDQAGRCKALGCRLAYDALPQAPSMFELVKAGKGRSELFKDDAEMDAPPTLFDNGRRSPPPVAPEPGAGQ